MPTLALLNGHAFAAGLMTAMMHDYRLFNPHRGYLCLNELDFGAPLKAPMAAVFRQKLPSPATYRTLVLEAIRSWRAPKPPKALRHPANQRRSDPRRLRRLLGRPPERRTAEERRAVQHALDANTALATGHALVQRFRTLLHERDLAAFHTWLADAQARALPSFVGLANGMLADRSAIEAAITEPWSNGVVEGQVHKVKLIKRQGYGRAKFDLLRRRVRTA